MTGQSSSQAATPIQWWKPALFFLVVIAGLWYVKWQPYYGKAFTAAETHSIGKSILAQADANPWQAASLANLVTVGILFGMITTLIVYIFGQARVFFARKEVQVDDATQSASFPLQVRALTVNGGATQGTIQAVINVTYTYA